MAKKYFVVSDLHSFCQPLLSSLAKAGFDKANPGHILIVLGDIFDRGDETLEIYDFLRGLPDDRLILIYGNHEHLYFELLNKKYPGEHDFGNGTVKTFCHIAKEDPKYLALVEYGDLDCVKVFEDPIVFWKRVRSKVKKSEITKWLKSDSWRNYYELGRFVFVHSFIPVELKTEFNASVFMAWPKSRLNSNVLRFRPDWRNATDSEWSDATWGCPFRLLTAGCFDGELKNGKTLVCGHWHTSDFYWALEKKDDAAGEIYFSDGIIGVDGGVSVLPSGECCHKQNVLVIDENMNCFDESGNSLPYNNEKELTA